MVSNIQGPASRPIKDDVLSAPTHTDGESR